MVRGNVTIVKGNLIIDENYYEGEDGRIVAHQKVKEKIKELEKKHGKLKIQEMQAIPYNIFNTN